MLHWRYCLFGPPLERMGHHTKHDNSQQSKTNYSLDFTISHMITSGSGGYRHTQLFRNQLAPLISNPPTPACDWNQLVSLWRGNYKSLLANKGILRRTGSPRYCNTSLTKQLLEWSKSGLFTAEPRQDSGETIEMDNEWPRPEGHSSSSELETRNQALFQRTGSCAHWEQIVTRVALLFTGLFVTSVLVVMQPHKDKRWTISVVGNSVNKNF